MNAMCRNMRGRGGDCRLGGSGEDWRWFLRCNGCGFGSRRCRNRSRLGRSDRRRFRSYRDGDGRRWSRRNNGRRTNNGHWCDRRRSFNNSGNNGSGNRRRGHRLGSNGLLNAGLFGAGLFLDAWRLFAGDRWGNGWLDHHYWNCGRRDHHHGARHNHCACRRLGHDRAGGWTRGNGPRGRGSHHNGWSLARLWEDLAWLGTAGRSLWVRRRHHGRRVECGPGRGGGLLLDRRWGTHRQMTQPRCFLIPLLLLQNRLHHVAGLGDMGEIDFGRNRLRGA